jgi:hypothetical protein
MTKAAPPLIAGLGHETEEDNLAGWNNANHAKDAKDDERTQAR